MKKTKLTGLCLLLGLGGAIAQENTIATGSEATGSGGTASYTVGQVAYTYNTGFNGSISEGVQQSYDINITSIENENSILATATVFPNPTTDYLTLQIETEELINMSYQLIDIQGKIILNDKITNSNTSIKMDELSKSTYFLNLIDNNKSIKTYKILKK